MVTLRLCQAIPLTTPTASEARTSAPCCGVVWQWVRDQLYAGVVAAGYDDLNAAHVGLWRYPGLEGLRPSQLADRGGSRNSRSTTCSGTWNNTGTCCACPIRPTEGLV